MKNIIFTIQTSYSEENYFLTANENENIELQIDDAMADMCFCDDCKIVGYKGVSQEYVKERNKTIAEYERKYGDIEEEFCSGKYTPLDVIQDNIKWILESNK